MFVVASRTTHATRSSSRGGQGCLGDRDLRLDAGDSQGGPRPIEFGRKRVRSVAAHSFADLLERPARDLLDVGHLSLHLSPRRPTLEQPPRQLGLEGDHREAVAEQIVEVAGKAQPLFGRRRRPRPDARPRPAPL